MKEMIAIVGHPIGHSLSPMIYNYWFEKHNINAECITLDVYPEDLETAFLALKNAGFIGAAFTIPFKEEVLKLVEKHGGTVSKEAKNIGAVNMVKF